MRVGIPKGLLVSKYLPFFENFFQGLGAETFVSDETNKNIVNLGIKSCIDEACLPVKIFHGHVASIKDSCDYLVIPRIMSIFANEYICPKFCGLPEMVCSSIQGLPEVSAQPLYMHNEKALFRWCESAGSVVTRNRGLIRRAFHYALRAQNASQTGICEYGQRLTVMLAGHPYLLYDSFLNMNIVEKLRRKGIGIVTEEYSNSDLADSNVKRLMKKPFWTFQRKLYGAAAAYHQERKINGIIYLSSFACGIDSVVVDLIRYHVGDFPMLVIKLDEHTGEAGVDTRLEAFIDMLERRAAYENYNPAHGKCIYSG